MEQDLIDKIIVEYERGVPLHEINKHLILNLKTSEVYKIVRQVKNGILDKTKIVEEYKKGTKFFQIAKILNIPYDDVMRVINAYRKSNKEYNQGKFGDKVGKNRMDREFLKFLQPKSILDVFAGENTKYPKAITTSNDIDKKCTTTYHMDAKDLLFNSAIEGYKFDLVDLDPYGSCCGCWKDGIEIAQKGIIISYGDLMAWRYHCRDFEYWKDRLNERYNKYIETIHDLKYALISSTIEEGKRVGKNLHIWNTFGNWYWMRVYYTIK